MVHSSRPDARRHPDSGTRRHRRPAAIRANHERTIGSAGRVALQMRVRLPGCLRQLQGADVQPRRVMSLAACFASLSCGQPRAGHPSRGGGRFFLRYPEDYTGSASTSQKTPSAGSGSCAASGCPPWPRGRQHLPQQSTLKLRNFHIYSGTRVQCFTPDFRAESRQVAEKTIMWARDDAFRIFCVLLSADANERNFRGVSCGNNSCLGRMVVPEYSIHH